VNTRFMWRSARPSLPVTPVWRRSLPSGIAALQIADVLASVISRNSIEARFDHLRVPQQLRPVLQMIKVSAAAGRLRGGLAERVANATERELAEQDRLRRTADWSEGVRAAAERREPRFEGR
jgi:hypothetical protein